MTNFAIVGCGFIAKKHADAIQEINGANLLAVSDKFEESMQPYIEKYQVNGYSDMKEMLQNEDIDVVCICTPSSTHARLAIEVANAKKNIILEKPMAMNLEDANQIIEAAKSNNVKLSVVHPNRFRPVAIEFKKILDEKKLGKISHANCIVNWNRNQAYYDQSPWRGTKEHDGGALMNQAIHNLDLLIWFLGNPKEIFSMEATRIRNIEAEDVSTGVVKFENGAIASIQAATTVYPNNYEESITIFGEKGTVKIGGSKALYFKDLIFEGMDEAKVNAIIQNVEADPWGKKGHQIIIEDMVNSMKHGNGTAVTGEEARKSLKLVLKMYESAKKNQVVYWD